MSWFTNSRKSPVRRHAKLTVDILEDRLVMSATLVPAVDTMLDVHPDLYLNVWIHHVEVGAGDASLDIIVGAGGAPGGHVKIGGGDGRDLLIGGAGLDVLIGNTGGDRLNGGANFHFGDGSVRFNTDGDSGDRSVPATGVNDFNSTGADDDAISPSSEWKYVNVRRTAILDSMGDSDATTWTGPSSVGDPISIDFCRPAEFRDSDFEPNVGDPMGLNGDEPAPGETDALIGLL